MSLIICFFFRVEDDDEVFNIGWEFDELYYWYFLRFFFDDFDRIKVDVGKNVNDNKVLEVDYFVKKILKFDGLKIL